MCGLNAGPGVAICVRSTNIGHRAGWSLERMRFSNGYLERTGLYYEWVVIKLEIAGYHANEAKNCRRRRANFPRPLEERPGPVGGSDDPSAWPRRPELHGPEFYVTEPTDELLRNPTAPGEQWLTPALSGSGRARSVVWPSIGGGAANERCHSGPGRRRRRSPGRL